MVTVAGKVLRRVADLVDGARNETHGDKVKSFQGIAKRWSMYFEDDLSGTDYALMMVEMKLERIRHGGVRLEHLEDVMGYAACAVQLAVAEGLIKFNEVDTRLTKTTHPPGDAAELLTKAALKPI